MICDECHENEAVVFFTEISAGQRRELHLCEACAQKQTGLKNPFVSLTDTAFLANLLAGVLGKKDGDGDRPEAAADGQGTEEDGDNLKKTNLVCPECGMTYNEFIKFGSFGCPSCYQTFHFLLDGYLKKIQGNQAHTGKVPVYSGETVQLPQMPDHAAAGPETADGEISFTVDEDSTEAELRAALKRAIAREEYEEAARLRDLIRAGKEGTAHE